MNVPVFAIKSHNRVDVLRSKTLRTLIGCGVPLQSVHVFVTGPQQEAAYSTAFAGDGLRVVRVDVPGAMAAVAAIQRHFLTGTHVVHMDDDVAGLEVLVDGQLKPFTQLLDLCNTGFDLCKRVGTDLWGIYPVRNKFFMKENTTFDLKFVWAGCYGFVAAGAEAEPPSVRMKDDFERSIRSYARYGAVVRFNFVAAKTAFLTSTGGTAGEQQRLAMHVADAKYLAAKYPQYCTTVKKKGFGGLDVRLRVPKP